MLLLILFFFNLTQAIDLRKSCNCSKLPDADPRAIFAKLRQLSAEQKALKAALAEKNKTRGVTVSAQPTAKAG